MGVAFGFLKGEGEGEDGVFSLASHWAYVWSSFGGKTASGNMSLWEKQWVNKLQHLVPCPCGGNNGLTSYSIWYHVPVGETMG